jgi:aspartate carbamoyltransferase catalytic subunit
VSTQLAAWPHRHLLDVDALSRAELEHILDLAVEMRQGPQTNAQLLRNEVIGLAFYEASTRTRVSFEVAAKALGATTVDLSVAASSVGKGESLADTLRTLVRTGVTTVVLRAVPGRAHHQRAHCQCRRRAARPPNPGAGRCAHPA